MAAPAPSAGSASTLSMPPGVLAAAGATHPPSASLSPPSPSASSGSAASSLLVATDPAGSQHNDADLWGVTVRLHGADKLMIADLFARSSDPYVRLILDDGSAAGRKGGAAAKDGVSMERNSRVQKKTLNPEWEESFTWVCERQPRSLRLEVVDWDQFGPHDSLGHATIDLEQVVTGQPFEGAVALSGRGIKHGQVRLRCESVRIPNVVGRSTDELRGVRNVGDIVSLIDLKVVGAHGLGRGERSVFKSVNDPFATITFGLHHFKTRTIPNTNDPV